MNERPLQNSSKFFNNENAICKNDDFITSLLMEIHQPLTSHELVWIGDVN